jgi:hypothetical protein
LRTAALALVVRGRVCIEDEAGRPASTNDCIDQGERLGDLWTLSCVRYSPTPRVATLVVQYGGKLALRSYVVCSVTESRAQASQASRGSRAERAALLQLADAERAALLQLADAERAALLQLADAEQEALLQLAEAEWADLLQLDDAEREAEASAERGARIRVGR